MHSNLHFYLPSPSESVWHLGPIPLRAYALSILIGIGIAIAVGNRRFIARGGIEAQVADVAMWAVPFGVIGGRIYHVMTDWETYFGTAGKGFAASLRIWEGGLGIWGALFFGGVGAFIGCVRQGIPLPAFADSVAPGIAFAQASGRWGNWFNQELFGKPTDLPWALEIDPSFRPVGFEQFSTFHPTFLYESLWCVAIGFMVIWADKRFTLGHGRAFALYVAAYCAGRGAIESMRIDEARHILGIRFNVFTALVVGFLALAYMVRSFERSPGREVLVDGRIASAAAAAARQAEIDAQPVEKTVAKSAKQTPRRARTSHLNTSKNVVDSANEESTDKTATVTKQELVADVPAVHEAESAPEVPQVDEHIARFEELLAVLSEPRPEVEPVKAPDLHEILSAIDETESQQESEIDSGEPDSESESSLESDDKDVSSEIPEGAAESDSHDGTQEETPSTTSSGSETPARGRRAKPKKRW